MANRKRDAQVLIFSHYDAHLQNTCNSEQLILIILSISFHFFLQQFQHIPAHLLS